MTNIIKQHLPSGKNERIFNELETIFLSEGFRKTTLASLAKRLHCSRRTFYELADSKEALFTRTLYLLLQRIRLDGDNAINPGRGYRENIYHYLQAGVIGARRISRSALEDIDGLSAARKVFDEHQRARMNGLCKLIKTGSATGEFSGYHPQFVAEMMMACVQRIIEPEYLANSELTLPESFDEIYRLLIHGLATNPAQLGSPNELPSLFSFTKQ